MTLKARTRMPISIKVQNRVMASRSRSEIVEAYKALPEHIKKASTAIVWRGVSPYDGQRIMAIVSGLQTPSANDKTGKMAQLSILLDIATGVYPTEAINTGADKAICGECPLRLLDGSRICYVNVFFNEGSKFKAINERESLGYDVVITPEQLAIILAYRQRGIRFGSYGDPGMLPYELIELIITESGVNYTSYTHQWVHPWFDTRHFNYSMASIDHINTVELLISLHGTDIRYYRLLNDASDQLNSNEIMCPSDTNKRKDSGPKVKGKFARKITCSECGLCAGSGKAAKSIAIKEE